MILLVQFLLRLAFGMSAAMATVSPRQVTSGYFRNHLYVVLGLSALAALLCRAACPAALPWAAAAAVLSYVGAVCWLYEKRRSGLIMLLATSAAALVGAMTALEIPSGASTSAANPSWLAALRYGQCVSSGMLLGATMAAMLLGHWYLNAPGMELAPLKRLLVLLAVATALGAALCGMGLVLEAGRREFSVQDWLFVSLRWLFGLVGVGAMAWMARRTLDIPNTQSATGILYVAVIGAFVGETLSLLLSAEAHFPL